MWLSEELNPCLHTFCFFRAVIELKCSSMEENKLHPYSPLVKHTVVVGIPLRGASGYSKFTQEALALRGEPEDASPAPMLTCRAGLEKMLVEFGKEAEICISPII